MLYFLHSKPDSVEGNHVSGMSVATHLKRLSCRHAWRRQARPCTEVRILPLHPFVSERLFPKESFPFRSRRHCSHLSPRGGRALPATLLLFRACVRTFLYSPCGKQRLPSAEKHYSIICRKYNIHRPPFGRRIQYVIPSHHEYRANSGQSSAVEHAPAYLAAPRLLCAARMDYARTGESNAHHSASVGCGNILGCRAIHPG